jgi:hypothetical protein
LRTVCATPAPCRARMHERGCVWRSWDVASVSVVTDLLDKRRSDLRDHPHDQAFPPSPKGRLWASRPMRFSSPRAGYLLRTRTCGGSRVTPPRHAEPGEGPRSQARQARYGGGDREELPWLRAGRSAAESIAPLTRHPQRGKRQPTREATIRAFVIQAAVWHDRRDQRCLRLGGLRRRASHTGSSPRCTATESIRPDR